VTHGAWLRLVLAILLVLALVAAHRCGSVLGGSVLIRSAAAEALEAR
jgi:hypothetical protein